MQLEIEALDTLFFRDGKAFAAGEDVWADSTGLPSPACIYGALRAAYAVAHGIAPESIEDRTKSLKITGLHYVIPDNQICLPAPLDLGVEEYTPLSKQPQASLATRKVLPDDVRHNFPLSQVLEFPADKKRLMAENCLLDKTSFESYLDAETDSFEVEKLSTHVCAEPKIGIARDNATHSVVEGRLYRVEMQRFKGLKVIVEICGLNDFPESGLLKLGGEAKAARFSLARKAVTWKQPQLDGQFFKLYLATPAIFKQGERPDLSDFGIDAELIAAATAKPLAIGGFDIQKNQPKPSYQAVPAGSVYYYQSTAAPQTIIEKLHGKSISTVYPEQGFGLALVTRLQEQNP